MFTHVPQEIVRCDSCEYTRTVEIFPGRFGGNVVTFHRPNVTPRHIVYLVIYVNYSNTQNLVKRLL
jgi:hypothetical protein